VTWREKLEKELQELQRRYCQDHQVTKEEFKSEMQKLYPAQGWGVRTVSEPLKSHWARASQMERDGILTEECPKRKPESGKE
jgi:hypothetical protein